MHPLPRHLLPPKLLEIAEYCGDKTAMALLENYGGGEILGMAAANAFCQAFAGEIIQVPKAAKAIRALRNAEIRRLRNEGEPLFNVARKVGLTERQVLTICNGPAEACRQADMFDVDDM